MKANKKYILLSVLISFLIIFTSSCKVKEIFSQQSEDEIKPVELSFMYPNDGSGAIQKLIASFNEKHHEIKINGIVGGSAYNHYETLKAAYASGKEIPDIVLLHDTWYSFIASNDYILEMNDFLPDGKDKEYMEGMLYAAVRGDKLYGLPLWADTILLYYRKDLVKSPPVTWQELMNSAISVSKDNKLEYKILLPADTVENRAFFAMNFLSSYGSGFNLNSNPVKYKKDNVMDSLDMFSDMIDKDVISKDILDMDPESCRSRFEKGKALYMFNWSYARKITGVDDDSPVKGKVGVAALPGRNSGNKENKITGWILSVSRNTKNAKEAVKFIEYLTSSEGQLKIAVEGGMLPVRLNLYDQTDWKKDQMVPKVLETMLREGTTMFTGPSFDTQLGALSLFVKQSLQETDNKPEDVFDAMKKGLEKPAAENNSDEGE